MKRSWAVGGRWWAAVMTGVVLIVIGQEAGAAAKRLLTVFGGTGTNTQFTAGSIVFAGATDGNYTQDNTNLKFLNGIFHTQAIEGTTGTYSAGVSGTTGVFSTADGLTSGGRIVPSYFYVTYRQDAGETPTTATFWTAPEACKLAGVVERHLVAGTNGSAVTVSVAKDPSGTAPGAGTGLLTAALSLKSTINTNQSGALSATPSDVTFAAGDGLSVVLAGTMTAVAGVSVTFKFQRL